MIPIKLLAWPNMAQPTLIGFIGWVSATIFRTPPSFMVNICGKYVKITGSDFGTTPLTESEAAPGREFVDLRGLEKPPEDLLLRRPRTVIMSVDGDLEQNWFF